MTSLDLNYTDADKNGDQVTIRRVICVQSAVDDNYKLEIVHTTNLKGLEFKLYHATPNNNGPVSDGGYSYLYDASPISGNYINLSTSASGYKTAYDTQHQTNYDGYSKVQTHAEPLYWLADRALNPDTDKQVTLDEKRYNRTYYVCEVTWTETTKETDIFYVLAKTEP